MKKYCIYIKEALNSSNIAVKTLIIIGFIAFIETIATVFLDFDQNSSTDVAIRSVMSSIFGFIFGAQVTENSNLNSKRLQNIIASTVGITCIIVSILIHWLDAPQITASAVEIRNLLFASVGFLLSRAKSND